MSHLVSSGRANLGRFSEPFETTNLIDAQPFRAVRLPRLLRSLRLKEWQAFQAVDDRFFVCVSLFNGKALGIAQIRVFDAETGAHWVHEKKLPGFRIPAPQTLMDSRYAYSDGTTRLAFVNTLRDDTITLSFEAPADGDRPAIRGELTADYRGATPLVVSIPFPTSGSMYSQKGPARLSGTLEVGEVEHRFDPARAVLLMDDHKGYYPRVMTWDWLTGAMLGGDETVSFNLTRNQSADPIRYNENAFWLGGERHDLPPVTFVRRDTWRVRDASGHVDLEFEGQVEKRLDIRGGPLMRVNYKSPIGRTKGRLRGLDGVEVELEGALSMAEDFYIRF